LVEDMSMLREKRHACSEKVLVTARTEDLGKNSNVRRLA